MRPSKHKHPLQYYADKWGTTQMTVSNHASKGCDWDASDEDVCKWLIKHAPRKSAKMKEVIAATLKPITTEPEELGEQKNLEEMREYYSAKLDEATRRIPVEHDEIKFWNDLLLKVDESIRKSEAHAKKLGIDRGELMSRDEVERILRAMFWAGNACCDKYAKQIAQHLSNKEPAEVYEILAPNLTSLSLFEGLKKVAKVPGEINLPEWVIECAKTEEKQYIENDE